MAPFKTVKTARRLRKTMSPPEMRLWMRLRHRDPALPVIRRQHPVGPYVVDFYCRDAQLCVEIDGWSHNMGDQERDVRRTAFIEAQGLKVIRYSASTVLADPGWVAWAILNTAREIIAVRKNGLTAAPPPPSAVPLPVVDGEDHS